MTKVGLPERLRYRFHNSFAKGTVALIGWLGLVSFLLVVLVSVVVKVSGTLPEGQDDISFLHVAWMAMLRTMDPGTMGGDAGDSFFMFMMLFVTFGGIFIVSALVGVINNGIEAQIEELRKGRSLVCEDNHTIVLGWSPQVFSIIKEISAANESEGGRAIVILAEKDKVEMDDEIRDKCPDLRGSWVVCRSGDPIDPDDLGIVNPNDARSVIVLAPEGATNPDSHIIKTILALTNNPNRRQEPYHIVAEIRDPKNLEPAKLVGGEEATIIAVEDLISRITVQTCRQSGLSVVYTELLDFDGDEMYIREVGDVVGKTVGEAMFDFQQCAFIGLRKKDGTIQVMPPADQKIEPGDKVILTAEDDSTVRVSGPGKSAVDEALIVDRDPKDPESERTLILGWNRRGPNIVRELENYVAPGSTAVILADVDGIQEAIDQFAGKIEKLTIEIRKADTTDRRTLDGADISSFDHVIALSYSDELDVQEADARTLITLLHVRDIAKKVDSHVSIVSEMLDVKNRQLAEVTKADDFIVSDRLVSLMLSQLSEEKELYPVFVDLFDPDGAEIYLKPAGDYVALDKEVNFYTVLESARRKGEIAIGYRIAAKAQDAEQMYGVKVNPDKTGTIAYQRADKIIVLADS